MFRPSVFAALSIAAPAACLPEYTQVQGERVLYEHSDELHPCAGTARYIDGLVPFLERQLSVEAPEQLRFSWVAPDDRWRPRRSMARALGEHAWSNDPIHIHELAHVVTGGMPAMFFTEGLAEAVSSIDERPVPRYPVAEALSDPIWDPRATMTARRVRAVNYETASSFVRFLLVRRGPERFREFYRGLGGPVTMPWLREQFRRAYGLELDDEIAEFRREVPPCGADIHPLNQPECSATRVPWSSEILWEHEVSMACDAPGVVGGLGPDAAWPSFYAVTLEVPAEGYYALRLDNLDVTARFGPCFGCPWEPQDVLLERETSERTMSLAPGTYFLRVNAMSDESPDVRVQLQRQ